MLADFLSANTKLKFTNSPNVEFKFYEVKFSKFKSATELICCQSSATTFLANCWQTLSNLLAIFAVNDRSPAVTVK